MSAIGSLLGTMLVLFEVVLVARIVLDWVGLLGGGGPRWSFQARKLTHTLTEPVIAPVRRVLRPARIGSVSFDLAFTVVFFGVIFLQSVAFSL
jgi:YggT family protein